MGFWQEFFKNSDLKRELKQSERRALNYEAQYRQEVDEVDRLKEDNRLLGEAYREQYADLLEAFRFAEKDIRKYLQLWKAELFVLDIKPELEPHQTYDPRQEPMITSISKAIVDRNYYTYAKARWTGQILNQINETIRNHVTKWIYEVSDCDNFADVMGVAVQLAMIKAGKKRQAAFGILHSPTHAYNFYIDHQGEIWVYEPQNGETKGKLGETVAPYDTTKLFFMG